MRGAVWVCASLALAAGACKDQRAPRGGESAASLHPDAYPAPVGPKWARIARTTWHRRLWPDDPKLVFSEEDLGRSFERALDESGLFAHPGARDAVLHVEYGVSLSSDNLPRDRVRSAPLRAGASDPGHARVRAIGVEAAFMVRMRWAAGDDGDLLAIHVLAQSPPVGVSPEDLAERVRSHVERSLGDAAKELIRQERVRAGDAAVVVASLDAQDGEIRRLALEQVRERHLRDAVPVLLEMLRSTNDGDRDGAIGALRALRERRAVPILTEIAQFRDVDLMTRVVEAVGEIGGDDARAFLEFVADGHGEGLVQQMARTALNRLDSDPQAVRARP